MRPVPLPPSPRRTLATLTALLISAALSLGFAPLPTSLLLGNEGDSSKLAAKPCDLEKVSSAGADVSLSSPAVSAVDAVTAPRSAEKVRSTSPAATVPVAKPAAKPAAKVPTASLVGLLQSCDGVRPGGIVTSQGGLCTYNFIFTDGTHNYAGTAGHCILPGSQVSAGSLPEQKQVWPAEGPQAGPPALDGDGNQVGVFVYGYRDNVQDFALIRIADNVHVNPEMCFFGGPTGINNDLTSGTVTLHYYGNGQVLSALAPARSGVALNMQDPNEVSAHALAVPGDSGAGVISADGGAVGNISADSIGLGILEGIVTIPRIGPQIAAAEAALRESKVLRPNQHLTLRTAPLK